MAAKHLAIDASVMKAAGSRETVEGGSKNCRDFLIGLMKTGHGIIMTDDIHAEWKEHNLDKKSLTYGLTPSPAWYAIMRKKGRIMRRSGNTKDEALRAEVKQVIQPNAHAVVEKDMHLIEAALLADKIVASGDDKVKGHFNRASEKVEVLREITWINPQKDATCVQWLEKGAPVEEERLLRKP